MCRVQDADHFPHIVRVEPEEEPIHFCSLTCMDNFDSVEDGDA